MDIEKLEQLDNALQSVERSYSSAVSRGSIEDTFSTLKEVILKSSEWRKELLAQLKASNGL